MQFQFFANLYPVYRSRIETEEQRGESMAPSQLDASQLKARILHSKGFLLFALCAIGFCLLSSIFLYKNQVLSNELHPKEVLILGVVFSLLLTVFVLLFCVLSYKRDADRALRKTYLAILIVSGLSFSCIFPPATAPDEGSHAYSVYSYANFLTGQSDPEGGLMLRQTDKEVFDSMDTVFDKANLDYVRSEFTFFSNNNDFSECNEGVDATLSLARLPQLRIIPALGVAIGQVLGLGGLATFYLGRIFNYLSFALMCYVAYRITPLGKVLFMTLSLLPMVLYITSSLSYDAGLMGLCFLLIALCLRCKYQTEKVSLKQMASIIVVGILLAPCKLIYFLLSFLVLLIPQKSFKDVRMATVFKIAAIGLPIFSLLVFQLSTLFAIAGVDGMNINEGNRGLATEEFNTAHDMIGHPLHTLFVYANTIRVYGDFLLSSFLGYSLGWFQQSISTPQFYMLPYLGALLVAAQTNPRDEQDIAFSTKVAFLAIVFLGFFGITTSMYLAWTTKTELAVGGVQGRYYLPFAPLLFLLFRSKSCNFSKSPDRYILFGLTSMNFVYVIYIVASVLAI